MALLYTQEIKAIRDALSSSQPTNGTGYWVSTSWVSNAKKYYEAIHLPDNTTKSNKAKRSLKIRQRRGSDALPPWPQINSEITCPHGFLALNKSLKAKRRIMDKQCWKLLRKFYPSGAEFKVSINTPECRICASAETNCKLVEARKSEVELQIRQADIPTILVPLSNRKNGIPSQCRSVQRDVATEDELITLMSLGEIIEPLVPSLVGPLVPGLYTLIPRSWLKLWRQYLRDATVEQMPLLDTTSLLCTAHGLLVIPPHVHEYLQGTRRGLLQGLGDYRGPVYEITTLEEGEALMAAQYSDVTDFLVCFSCDGESRGCTWNLSICRLCDPYDRSHELGKVKIKRSSRK